MLVFVVKRYAVRIAKIGRYAVRKGEGSVTLNNIHLLQEELIPLHYGMLPNKELL